MKNAFLIVFISFLSQFSVAQCTSDVYEGFGGISKDKGQTLISDSAQNVYMTGIFTDSIQLGTFSLTTDSIGQFLCKMSPNGTILWAKNLFNSNNDYFAFFPPILKIDHSGQLVIAGTCQMQNGDFDTISTAFSNGDLYIARFNITSGTLNSFVNTGRHLYTYIYDMTIDLIDNVYLVGSFVGFINFGSTSLVCLGQTNSFLAKFDSQNQAQWARRVTTTPNTTGNVIHKLNYDNYNHVFVSGWFGLNADFGNGTSINSPVYSNGFIAKYDLNGNIKWAKSSDTSTTINHHIVMDTSSVITIQTSPVKLVNYNQDGDTIWTKILTNNNFNLFNSIIKYNNEFLGIGGFNSSLTMYGVTYTSPGYNLFITCFDQNGDVEWVRILPSLNISPANMSIDQQASIYLTGEYGPNNIINQTTTIPTWGNLDILFIKLCNGASAINDELIEGSTLSLYPNPVKDVLSIEIKHSSNITILNSQGIEVLQQFCHNYFDDILQIDVSGLAQGLYFIRTNLETKSFIKLR